MTDRPLRQAGLMRGSGSAAAAAPAPSASPPVESDRAPAARAQDGPLDFDRIYREHFHHVGRWARALGGLDADVEDLAQEVFLVVRRKLDGFSGPSMSAWLYGITRKTVSDYRRRAFMKRLLSGATRSLQAPTTVPPPAPGDAYERWERRRLLAQVLERMTPIRRTAFVLFEVEGYSGEEIAELEQIPVATAYTRLHHARKDFLRIMQVLDGEGARAPTQEQGR